MEPSKIKDPLTVEAIHSVISSCGGDASSFSGGLVTEIVQTALKLLVEKHDDGQIKLINRALKEMRYAYGIFNQYGGTPRISIFGSARTPEDHPDYLKARALSSKLAEEGWMVITGAAHGIMKAGLEGASRASSFGLSIRLPHEAPISSVLHGDVKLITFNYFFTRKLMFISHSDAVAVFPGGIGTQDELFESLTLMQTGKANIIPLIMMEGDGGTYWSDWSQFAERQMISNRWLEKEARALYTFVPTIEEAVKLIQHFYHRFHSYRYVGDSLVFRIKKPLTVVQLDALNGEFKDLVSTGKMEQCEALEEELEFLDLPRITFGHTRRDYCRLRQFIDRINDME